MYIALVNTLANLKLWWMSQGKSTDSSVEGSFGAKKEPGMINLMNKKSRYLEESVDFWVQCLPHKYISSFNFLTQLNPRECSK